MREYREYHEQSSSSNRTLWIVLGIVGGIVVVGLLVCGGLGFLFLRAVKTGMAQVQVAMQQTMTELDLQDEDYAKARTHFKTKLIRQGAAPQPWAPVEPPAGVKSMEYRSGALRLKAWINPPADPGQRKLPAVLFLHGGWAFGEDDWDMTKPYRDAGYVVMAPMLRGENGQSGSFTMFSDEVDDVLAAADALARLPYVDDKHIYVSGHSAGGTLTLLAAMASPRFKAAAAFSASPNQKSFALQDPMNVPFDQGRALEYEMRSPMAFATSFKCPVRMYYGDDEQLVNDPTDTTVVRAKTKGLDVDAIAVPGDHTTSVPEAMRQAIQFFQEKQ
ncbi:MAG TPA: alpha/beta fold hydrolase [Gemmataceae bacterium]|jgi:dipeptidyl aminopeptidase/acylaminoacyl peptidase|nr:alpha/beta fold hydrolase [Gemmataceae bacterium]